MKFLLLLFLAVPLKAQVYYGDTSITRLGDESRGYFYLDTLEYIGHRKVDSRKPWVYEVKGGLQYWTWWMETANCQGLRTNSGEFRKYRWFVVNAESFGTDSPFKIGFGGYTLIDSMAVYLAAPLKDDKGIVMHEQTHALMWLHGEGARHTYKRFGNFGCGFRYVTMDTADPELRR